MMFASQRKGLPFQLQEGQQVIVTGSVDVYERDGKYQLYPERSQEMEQVICLNGFRDCGMNWKKWECLRQSINDRSPDMREQLVL